MKNVIIFLIPVFFIFSCTTPVEKSKSKVSHLLAVEVENANNPDRFNTTGTFGTGSGLCDDKGNTLIKGIHGHYDYFEVLDETMNSYIYDKNNSGPFDNGKYFRIIYNGLNVTAGAGMKLVPVAMNLDKIISPPTGYVYIDPARARFSLPAPSYWSGGESIRDLTDAVITEELPVIKNITGTAPGYLGTNCIYNRGNILNSYIYPFGENYSLKKGTLSLWVRVETSNINSDGGHFFLHLNAAAPALTMDYSRHGKSAKVDSTGYTLEWTNWTHVYVTWDNTLQLPGNRSIIVYIDGVERLSSTSNITCDNFYLRTYTSADFWTVYLDNIKVWKDDVNAESTWIYNAEKAGPGQYDDALHSVYGASEKYQPLQGVQVGYYKSK